MASPEGIATTAGRQRTVDKVTALYEEQITGAVRFAYLVCGDAELAQDLAHDSFIRVTSKLGTLRSPDKVGAYLRTTIVNAHRTHLRKTRRERLFVAAARRESERATELPDVGARQEITRALAQLPPRRRAAVILRYYEDMTERQTAEVLGCSVPAAKALVARGLETLRRVLGGGPE